MTKKRAPPPQRYSLSYWVAGQEKFLTMLLGAVAVYVQATHYIGDPDIKNLITAVIVAMQGWLATNSGTASLEQGEVVVAEDDVKPGADSKPPRRELPTPTDDVSDK